MMRCALLVALCVALSAGNGAAAAENGWEAISRDGSTSVWSRAVHGTNVREMRVKARLRWPAQRLMALIGDLDNHPSFMAPTEHARSLQRHGATGRWYIVIKPPLIDRRDYCVEITISRLPDGRLESRFGRTEHGCPPQRAGLVRMARIEGRWTLTPMSDGTTEVEYQAVTDPAGDLPIWMVNRAAGGSIRDMFRTLDRVAADRRIAPCPGSSLGCVVAN